MSAVNPSAECATHTPLPELAPDRILDDMAVSLITTMPRSTIVRLSHHGHFPKPVVLYSGRIGWRMSDVQAWIASRLRVGESA